MPKLCTTAERRRHRLPKPTLANERQTHYSISSMLATAQNLNLARAMARLDALTDWERRPRGAMRVGLEPMLDLAARLGDPQKAFRSIHVAGTKGKGSVSALIEAALAHAGLRVGRYGSPHVERVTERVSVQGREIDEPALARALNRALDAYEAARAANTPAADATWFDLLTAAAFIVFAEARLEWAVVEVGLGGRLDSTNIVMGEVAIVTNIELEHTEILGNSRPAIAGEKVGILKPGAVLVTTLGPDDEAGRVLQARADELACPVIRTRLDAAASVDAVADRVPMTFRATGLAATIEETNVALAGAALDQLGLGSVRARSAAAGEAVGAWLLDAETRAAARLPGRMERFDIDVGSETPAGRVGRRARAVQSQSGIARSRPHARSFRPVRGDRRAGRRQGRQGLRERARRARLGDRLH